MVNWDQWQTLLAVFRAGSFAKAAVALQVNATTVGRRIKLLEQQLGHPLFLRHDRRFYPTHQCEALITHVESASEVLRAAEQDSAIAESGEVWRDLRMTAPPFLIHHLFAPAVTDLVEDYRIRIELLGTGSNLSLSRREADIAVRIEDRRPQRPAEAGHVDAERIGVLAYAVYCRRGQARDDLPWAGLIDDHVRTTGGDVMLQLAGSRGFRFRAYHFDVLAEIAATGAARAMLPCLLGGGDPRLECVSDVVLRQPLWMLHHRQDRDVRHQQGARSWIRACVQDRLVTPPAVVQAAETGQETHSGMS
ncbi:MAG: LysR family transcriptional regulator [Geminicoccaceae bacterium]